MIYDKYLIFTNIMCNNCILSNIYIGTKEGVIYIGTKEGVSECSGNRILPPEKENPCANSIPAHHVQVFTIQ